LSWGDGELPVLDELTCLVNDGWESLPAVVEGIGLRSPTTSVVVTGPDAPSS
jgi:ATP:corrinoid adenosyltransferase